MRRTLFILLLFIPLYLSGQVISSTVSYATGPRTYLDVINDGNTKGWYIAEVGDLTKDGTDSVSVWADHLGSGRNLLAADNTKAQPIWITDYLDFNGAESTMKTGAYTFAQPVMIYMVLKQVTYTFSPPDYLFDGIVAGKTRIYQYEITPAIVASADTPSDGNSDLALDTWGILRALYNGASSKLQINTETAVTGNFGSDYAGGFTIGSYGDTPATRNADIQVREIILRNKADAEADQTLILNYLNTKYSVY